MTRQQELDVLKGQAEYFEDVLDSLRQRIEQLEASAEGPPQLNLLESHEERHMG